MRLSYNGNFQLSSHFFNKFEIFLGVTIYRCLQW
nr:MAG TPA: hypothetical protein [Ackermannviridae sp.]